MTKPSVLKNAITDPYNPFEAMMYDTFFAVAVFEMASVVLEQLYSSLSSGAEILDVGCGGGHIALSIANERNDIRVRGIDLSVQQIERATKRSSAVSDRVHFDVGSALALPYADSQFDGVLTVTSIKHWTSRLAGLHECLRVLKPGGTLLVVEVDRGAHLDDVRTLLSHSRVPKFLRGLVLPFLRTFIMGQSIDLDECRELMADLPLDNKTVMRTPQRPGLIMSGQTKGPAEA